MKVMIINCSDKSFWYKCYIGKTFKVVDSDSKRYYILTQNLRIKVPILKTDCEVIEK